MSSRELRIKVPWGHIAAKLWGAETDPIVLVFHGILDNAGSFDRLIPLLPPSFFYVCCDLPGHGHSSHFPPFLPIHTIDYLVVYKLIVRHFNRSRYIIMGHSYGAQIGILFARLYPEHVEKLIMLDAIHFFPILVGQMKQALRDKYEHVIQVHEKAVTRARPAYTREEALQRLIDGRLHGGITREAAEALLVRALEPAGGDKFAFTADPRLKQFLNPMQDFSYIIESFRKFPVTCPVLVVFGKESDLQQIYFKKLINHLKRNKNFVFKSVEGNHDVHNNNPENVAPHVSRFLLKGKGKL